MSVSDIGSITTADLNRDVMNVYEIKGDMLLFHISNSHDVYKTSNERRINSNKKQSTNFYFTSATNELPTIPNGNTVIHGTKDSVFNTT